MHVQVRRWGVLAGFALWSTAPVAVSAAEPCKLLTLEEVNQVLGSSVVSTPLGSTGCLWKSSSGTVSIVLHDATSWPRITAQVPGITKTNVGGIGDAAQYSGLKDTWTLSVKQVAKVIVLTVGVIKGVEKVRPSEAALARLALGRL